MYCYYHRICILLIKPLFEYNAQVLPFKINVISSIRLDAVLNLFFLSFSELRFCVLVWYFFWRRFIWVYGTMMIELHTFSFSVENFIKIIRQEFTRLLCGQSHSHFASVLGARPI